MKSAGGFFQMGKSANPLTENDRPRMKAAEEVCGKILVEAGAEPDSIFTTPLRGTHPSGTVRIGRMLDQNCRPKLKDYTSATPVLFPKPWAGRLC